MKGWKRARRMMPKSKCARGSFRTLDTESGDTRILICCPKGPGHWNKRTKQCNVGTRAYEILRRTRRKRLR